LLKKEYREKLH